MKTYRVILGTGEEKIKADKFMYNKEHNMIEFYTAGEIVACFPVGVYVIKVD
jgi:hypothetical protein